MYNQISQLNNELVNTKRALTKQNYQLNVQTEKLRVILTSIKDGVFVTDPDYKITFANNAALELTGLDTERIKGTNIQNYLYNDNEGVLITLSREELDQLNKTSEPVEVQLIGNDIKTPVDLIISGLKNNDGSNWGYVHVVHDLRARKKMEREQQEINQILSLLNKILRHDILNDLNIINLAMDLYYLRKDEKYLEKCKPALKKSFALIKDISNLENIVSAGEELEEYELAPVIREIIPVYNIEINIKGNAVVLADQALSSLFDNLIKNAIIHGKTERVDIDIREIDQNYEKVCQIDVKDQGRGIPDEIKPFIFDNEFKYGETGHSGLGLYIVKKVVERYGGRIEVLDNKPKGTWFSIELKIPGYQIKTVQ